MSPVLDVPLGGESSSLTLTEDEWADLAALCRSYIALARQNMAAPGRYTDLDLATQVRRRVLATRLLRAAERASASAREEP